MFVYVIVFVCLLFGVMMMVMMMMMNLMNSFLSFLLQIFRYQKRLQQNLIYLATVADLYNPGKAFLQNQQVMAEKLVAQQERKASKVNVKLNKLFLLSLLFWFLLLLLLLSSFFWKELRFFGSQWVALIVERVLFATFLGGSVAFLWSLSSFIRYFCRWLRTCGMLRVPTNLDIRPRSVERILNSC